MIKLVVSDLDGTLLDDKKILRQEAVDCIRKLRKKGIYFAAASGRQLRSLQRVFHEIENDVIFIAEDGNRYHLSLTCSGIVRNIIATDKESVTNMPACSSCGKE